MATIEEEMILRGRRFGLIVPTGVGIPDYVPPRKEGAPTMRIGKNAKYIINMSTTPKGIHVMGNIV